MLENKYLLESINKSKEISNVYFTTKYQKVRKRERAKKRVSGGFTTTKIQKVRKPQIWTSPKSAFTLRLF